MALKEATGKTQQRDAAVGATSDEMRVDMGKHLGSFSLIDGDRLGLVEMDNPGTYIPDLPRLFTKRKWEMPNRYTFKIKCVDALLNEEMNGGIWVDPFAGMYSPARVTNDLNPNARAIFHMDALEFLKAQPTAHYDGVLYDPPYSQRQVRECYDRIGIERWDGRMTFWSNTKNECARIIKPGGKAICCGWNSMGLGKGRGFEMTRILLVAHGGSRNDTIVTVESSMTR